MKIEERTRSSVTSAERLGALRATDLLDTPREESFDRLTRLAARLVGAPTALVSLVDEDRQFFKSSVGLDEDLERSRETPLSHSYCKYVVATGRPFVIEDARENEITKDSPAIADYDAISYCGVPLRDGAGHLLGSFCVLDTEPHQWSEADIQSLSELAELVMTELRLRKLANDLDTANKALSASNEALRDFISVASHDMKNPLTSVLGFSSMMSQRWESIADDDKKGFVEIIERKAQFLARLVDDLLTLSRVEAGAAAHQPEEIDVAEVLDEFASESGASDTDSKPRLEIEEGTIAFADPDHFLRIMSNLLTNARKYGASPFLISVRSDERDVLIEVVDHGEGVPESFVHRLFQKFSRAEETKTARDGTGLGLSIVRSLAELNGGRVDYLPNDPNGSRFVVTLPRARRI